MVSRVSKRTRGARRSDGVILIVAIVCIAMASVMLLAILQTAVAERKAVETEAWRQQHSWLAESGLERAAAQLAADPSYQGETWNISADELGGKENGVVLIEVQPLPDAPENRKIRVRADFPDDPQHRARRTKETTVRTSPSV